MSLVREDFNSSRCQPDAGVWRIIFGSAAVMNFIVGLSLIFARGWLKTLLPLNPIEGTNRITLYLTSGLVILFGIVYARASIRAGSSREMLLLCGAGKITGAVSVVVVILEGAASLRLLPLALIDLAFAGAFIAYLGRGRKGVGSST